MIKVKFLRNSHAEFQADTSKTLMKNLLDQNIPVASSCHGDGVCSKCRIKVVTDSQKILMPESDLENQLKEKNKISKDHRISCLCFFDQKQSSQKDCEVIIDTSYW